MIPLVRAWWRFGTWEHFKAWRKTRREIRRLPEGQRADIRA